MVGCQFKISFGRPGLGNSMARGFGLKLDSLSIGLVVASESFVGELRNSYYLIMRV